MKRRVQELFMDEVELSVIAAADEALAEELNSNDGLLGRNLEESQ